MHAAVSSNGMVGGVISFFSDISNESAAALNMVLYEGWGHAWAQIWQDLCYAWNACHVHL